MTAKDEDILTSQTLLRKGMALEKFLQNIILNKQIDPTTLLVGDRNAILVAARISGYGAEYETKTTCPSCGHRGVFAFDLSRGVIRSGGNLKDLNAKRTKNGTFSVKLPLTKVNAEVRLLTGADETTIAQQNAQRKKNSLLETTLTNQLSQCIVSLNDDTDVNTIKQFVELMPAIDSRHIRKVIKTATPNLDLSQNFQCSECDHEQEMEVPFTTDFFWPN
jgi:transcription elongation factor Elf1